MTVLEADLDALDPDLERDDVLALIYRRVTGRFRVDEWGLDHDLLTAVSPLARLRWSVRIAGGEHVPEVGPALLLHTRRLGVSEPAALGMAIRRTTGRPLRVAGVPSRGPLVWPARRLGGVPSNPADLRSLFRAGELVSLPLAREPFHPDRVPEVPRTAIEVALAADVPVLPVAVVGVEPARTWTVRIGAAVATRRRVALETDELAAIVRARLQQLLTPPRRR
jgi:hypothetical protein